MALSVASSSCICSWPVAHGRQKVLEGRVLGERLGQARPSRTGRGSTTSAAPKRLAATMPAPYVMPPWVSVGPSSTTATRFPSIVAALERQRRAGRGSPRPAG